MRSTHHHLAPDVRGGAGERRSRSVAAAAEDAKAQTHRAGRRRRARSRAIAAPSRRAPAKRALAYQLRRLGDLEQEVRDEVEKLEIKESAAREWVTKREAMMKAATDDVVAIYGKMPADAAAAQIAEMDEPVAVAVLAKLNPRVAGAILGEMEAEKAAKLSSLIARRAGRRQIMIPRLSLVSLALSALLAGCAPPLKDFMRAPDLSPVGTGMQRRRRPTRRSRCRRRRRRVAAPRPINLYTDQRIAHVGDILTVVISINDKATVGNATDRKTTSNGTFGFDWLFSPETSGSGGSQTTPLTYKHDFNSTSSSQGNGDINRSEQIQLSVPAVVTHVLPNGNLVISGSQEVRVNFELRQLTSPASSGRPTSRATTPSPTIASPRRASPTAAAGGSPRSSSPPGASRSTTS